MSQLSPPTTWVLGTNRLSSLVATPFTLPAELAYWPHSACFSLVFIIPPDNPEALHKEGLGCWFLFLPHTSHTERIPSLPCLLSLKVAGVCI